MRRCRSTCRRKAVGPGADTKAHGRGYKQVGLPPTAAASAGSETGAAPRPGRGPIVLALPLENLSGDSNQQFFSVGIAQDIIDPVSRQRIVSVVARRSPSGIRAKSNTCPSPSCTGAQQ